MNEQNKPLDNRDAEGLSRALSMAQHTVYKKYLSELTGYEVIPPTPRMLDENARTNALLFRLDELACKKGEDPFQKLSTVYHAGMSLGCSLFVLIDVPKPGEPADIYLGVRDGGESRNNLITSFKALKNGLRSNFPGTRLHDLESTEAAPQLLDEIFDYAQYVSAVSCVAALRDKSKTEEKGFVQGLERFLDTMQGSAYTALLLAEPVTGEEQASVRRGYEELYTVLSPFRKSSWSYNETEGTSVMESLCSGLAKSVTNSTAHTQGHAVNVGINGGINLGIVNSGTSAGYSKSVSDTVSRAFANTTSENRARGETRNSSTGRTLQIENANKPIGEMLSRIEEQLKRTREGEDYGAYSCGAYFLSDKQDTSLLAANTYRALLLGEGSSVESGAINAWNGTSDQKKAAHIKEYLKRFVHPLFAKPVDDGQDGETVMPYTPGTTVSGLELPLHLGLPTRSVYGLPVLAYAEFGRNVNTRDHREGRREITLGKIYHMGRTETAPVPLDAGELTAHTFITGSTGAGKSNTIYQLLDKLCFQGKTKFLVIEPAKGEYKGEFGGREGVSVYGTNPRKTALLHLNPFSFPEDIHALEHIDRLVEVFNACWPMYAAMPAVLKDAMEASYVSCGWNLTRSICAFSPARFPTFATLLQKLPEVLDSSAYSRDTKGDYTGALVTRVKSLTNGINGQIFCTEEELAGEKLFEENVIVDLSRVGSMETKALLMGILMIKLQEYRMAMAEGSNAELRHVTVLEEAHNLLRRTSAGQSQESSNLQGKSVEMLANAIAEMRTYGEGFIIADQAPGLLDMAIIRNTNTKIIMRLPDESDRQLVGKAAGLNDDQIVELAKLDTGVAAVFQNHWLEPVLCRMERFKGGAAYQPENLSRQEMSASADEFFRLVLHGAEDGGELPEERADRIRRWVDRFDTGRGAKEMLLQAAEGQKRLTQSEKGYLFYCLAHGRSLIKQMENRASPSDIQAAADQWITDTLHVSAALAGEIRPLIFQYAAEQVRHDETMSNDLRYYGGVK